MPTVIMPKMGDGMEEGTLLRWLKEVGQEVAEGEPLAEIETDKVSLEIEATEAGVLTKTLVGEGDVVPIGSPIATIGEDAAAAAPAAPAPAPASAADADAPDRAAASGANGRAPTADDAPEDERLFSPAARRGDADGAAVDAEAPPANGAALAAAAPAPVAPARAAGERLRASPLVKRLAAEHGIDLEGVVGTGPGGRIVKENIAHLLTGAPQAAPTAPAPAPTPAAPEQPAPTPEPTPVAASTPAAPIAAPAGRPAGVPREMSRIRRTTGRRMTESKQAAPHFYVTAEVDMAPARLFREQVNAQVGDDASKVSFNDLIVKAAALALREFPNLNASLEGDRLVDHPNIDVNIAVAIEGGLIAPFVPDADQKSLGTIARMAKDLIGRARSGGLTPEEFQGGTFTVSNLGMYDVEEFIAIINPPQAAILAVGSIKETPVVANGEIAVGHRMNVTLSADHRVTDGAEVARCLQAIKRYLENPMLLALS
jgi:pyruvate dehydrogenase E2 component (dihydrolipoamide acetyltransferase)